MKNTDSEIILKKINSCQRWNQWQGKRGRFIKGNPGRGFTAEELDKLRDFYDYGMNDIRQNFKNWSSADKLAFIRMSVNSKSSKTHPSAIFENVKTMVLTTITIDDLIKVLNAKKDEKL